MMRKTLVTALFFFAAAAAFAQDVKTTPQPKPTLKEITVESIFDPKQRVAFTGTNPRPVLLKGTAELCGGALDARVFKGLDEMVRDQIMSMKTTFTPGHYRRRVAGVLARRLVATLFGE